MDMKMGISSATLLGRPGPRRFYEARCYPTRQHLARRWSKSRQLREVVEQELSKAAVMVFITLNGSDWLSIWGLLYLYSLNSSWSSSPFP